MTEKEKQMVTRELDRLSSVPIGAMVQVRVPLLLLLDESGSMEDHHSVLQAIVTELCELKISELYDFTLCVVVIHNSVPKLAYFGELYDFDENAFAEGLPKEYGMTPLASGYSLGDELLRRVSETLECHSSWYTIPVVLSVTDSKENGSLDDVSAVRAAFREDIAQGNMLMIEFVTQKNAKGLDLGGYRVLFTNSTDENLKQVRTIMRILRYVSSTSVKQGDAPRNRPPKSDRKAYCRYLSDTWLFNFRVYFDNYYSE